jgi:glutamate-1-semialdehyde 2,1-aminomutase
MVPSTKPVPPPAAAALRRELAAELRAKYPLSHLRCASRGSALLDQTSHAVRWNEPFMVTAARCEGAAIFELGGARIVDYWQGHYANVLGHQPAIVRDALQAALADGRGLQSGMLHDTEHAFAELLTRRTATETLRFTTSGALATFYSVLLARGFTGRRRVLKIAGGWHGSQPFGLKGVTARDGGFDHLESEGLPGTTAADIELVPYNDPEALERVFAERGGEFACLLLEPWIGAGGGIGATPEFLRAARRLTAKHGALLLCDEIIAGFRFRAGDLCSLYGVAPDLLILGKAIGGGMPVAAVAGRREVMELASRASRRVKFEGGTYSAHELSMVAGMTMVRHLVDHEATVYPALAQKGATLRAGLETMAAELRAPMWISGWPNDAVAGSSLAFVRFGREHGGRPLRPEEMVGPGRAHPAIDDDLLRAALLLEGVSAHNGLGGASLAHDDGDLAATLAAYRRVVARFAAAGLFGA